MTRPVVVAVDGPSGSGKSSVSKDVARRIGGRYLDTGAMYRAMTLWMLDHRVEVHDGAAVAAQADEPRLDSQPDPDSPRVRLDGVDVSNRVRDADVTAAVSYVSAVPEVRARLVRLQREAVTAAVSAGQSIVVEGRDIGGVVLPDADVKVFLTADVEVRAARRHLEEVERGSDPGRQAALESIAGRDAIDSTRSASPLQQPPGSVLVDATHLDLDGVVAKVMELVDAAALRH